MGNPSLNRSSSETTPVSVLLKAHISFLLSYWSILTCVKQYFALQTEKHLHSTYDCVMINKCLIYY